MAISDAVGLGRISRVVGYKITKGNFSNVTPNLPQRIAILGEANAANQSGLSTDPVEVTTLQQAADLYGYGSPIYNVMRILRPVTSSGVGYIPTVVYPQAEAAGAVAAARDITPTGTATGNTTHTVKINGREGIDGTRFDISVVTGDTVAIICGKITSAINNVLGSTVIAMDNTTSVTLTAKWKGLTSEDINAEVEVNGKAFGMSYAVSSSATGSGTPSVTSSLNKFASDWNTIVVNTYGTETTVLTSLEAFNGIPDPTTPTGRFVGVVMKPFIALYGTVAATGSGTITDARKAEVTNAICPAPSSKGLPMEAAANMAVLFATVANENPHLDVNGKSYPDMPGASDWTSTDMVTYDQRDLAVKKGSTTVDYVNEKFQVQDFTTSYHPDGETPPQFRYARNLMLDFNVRFGYYLLEQIHVVDHAIASNADVITVGNVIKPKQWAAIVNDYAKNLGQRGLIADVSFMQDSVVVGISDVNPDRLETFFRYKRTGIARISSTTAEAGFNFGGI